MNENRQEVEKIDSKENFIRLLRQYQNLVFSVCLKLTGDYFAAQDAGLDGCKSIFDGK